MCPSLESDISTDKRAVVQLGLSVPSLVMGQPTVPRRKELAALAQEGVKKNDGETFRKQEEGKSRKNKG